ncbi:MAG: hypothetical protein QXV32_04725 [Conexivisphaerales archaeon]
MTSINLPERTAGVGIPNYTGSLMRWSFVIGLIPVAGLLIALAIKSLYLLQYVHVLTGGTWTGFDLFMGLVMTRIMRNLDIGARVEVAKRLTPTTFFIMPSLASTAIASGIYLAERMNIFNIHSPWIIAAGIVVIILSAQGFGIFMPNGLRIFVELAKPSPDTAKISKLNMQNIRLAGSQAIFQVILILIMAHLAVY